ncbi:Succinate/fumarate mitochondrial transporter [Zancudomyces culisetae]|uniref:Succinate/fumarate mitochondrial transporter n=1 Tax=Zancudomyces culisetae TaxID=1213189 RepID=A0A1R1PGR1_ZANCU|nr:Succinate/fumarate mitochondrial transporter [Zancudomyces culisetae]|eukprot:OMH80042.1 Succinate/fumarate mitochondrial transporter [Zancudomyces culisetae]
MASKGKERTPLSTHLLAGGAAGFAEACVCHPLDTIKVRMQLSNRRSSSPRSKAAIAKGVQKALPPKSFVGVGAQIVRKEGFGALYKGLGAVVLGIVPKMAIRFSSFELFKSWMADKNGNVDMMKIFLAGLGAGTTEAIAVVTPMDVIKIRLQAQRHSLMDPLDVPKYRNAPHAAYTIIREEGFGALYKGVALTALRQATNQAANFTAYHYFKNVCLKLQGLDELPSYQHLLLGGISGAMGPLSNAPIDTIKTRIQKSPGLPGQSGWSRFMQISQEIIRNEGYGAFYKGLTPRVLRVAPGQAITFMVYERVKSWIDIFNGKAKAASIS